MAGFLAVAHSQGNGVTVLDAESLEVVAEPVFGEGAGRVDFSPDGSMLAVVGRSSSPTLRVFSTEDWAEVYAPSTLDGICYGLQFNHDATQLLVATDGGTGLKVFDTTDWSELPVPPRPGAVLVAMFSPDGSLLLGGDQSAGRFVLRTSDWSEEDTSSLPGPLYIPYNISNAGDLIVVFDVVGGGAYSVDPTTWQIVNSLPVFFDLEEVELGGFSPEDSLFAFPSGPVVAVVDTQLWSAEDPNQAVVHLWDFSPDGPRHVAFHPDEESVAVGMDSDPLIRSVALADGEITPSPLTGAGGAYWLSYYTEGDDPGPGPEPEPEEERTGFWLEKVSERTYIPGEPGVPEDPGEPAYPGRPGYCELVQVIRQVPIGGQIYTVQPDRLAEFLNNNPGATSVVPVYESGFDGAQGPGGSQPSYFRVTVPGNEFETVTTTERVCFPPVPPRPAIPPTPAVPPTPGQWLVDKNLGWNAGAYSQARLEGDVDLTFQVDIGSAGAVALTNRTLEEFTFRLMPWGFRFTEGVVDIVEGGVPVGEAIPYENKKTRFSIQRFGGMMYYRMDNEIVRISETSYQGQLWVVAALYAAGDRII